MNKRIQSSAYPRKVPSALPPRRVVLDSVQHQIERKDGHTEDGPAAHGHLLLQFHSAPLI